MSRAIANWALVSMLAGAAAFAPGARASFSFSGTSVTWIGYRGAEGYQDTVHTGSALAPGAHTITVEATGRKHPEATSNYVAVDAFDVVP